MLILNIIILLLCMTAYCIHPYFGNIFTIIAVLILFVLILYITKHKKIKSSEQYIASLCNSSIEKLQKNQWEKVATIFEKHYKIKINRNDKNFQTTIKALIERFEKENKYEHGKLIKKLIH